jgi:hypothetical protein
LKQAALVGHDPMLACEGRLTARGHRVSGGEGARCYIERA